MLFSVVFAFLITGVAVGWKEVPDAVLSTAKSGQAIKGDIYTAKHEFPQISISRAGEFISKVKRITYQNESTLQYVVAKRKPIVIAGGPSKDWPALKWDLQQMAATSWQVLENVLALEAKPCENMKGTSTGCNGTAQSHMHSTFFMHEDDNGWLLRHSAPGSATTAPQLIREMRLQEYLDEAVALSSAPSSSSAASSSVQQKSKKRHRRYFFSTDFAALESALQEVTVQL